VNGYRRLQKIAALLVIGLWIAFVALDPLDGLLSPVDGIAVRSMSAASAKLAANTHAIVEDDGQAQASPSVIAALDALPHSGMKRDDGYRRDTDGSIPRAPSFPLYKLNVHFLI
jgi:hypothetical protein